MKADSSPIMYMLGVHRVWINRWVMWCFSPKARVSTDLTRGFQELNSAELVECGSPVASSRRARIRSTASSDITVPV